MENIRSRMENIQFFSSHMWYSVSTTEKVPMRARR